MSWKVSEKTNQLSLRYLKTGRQTHEQKDKTCWVIQEYQMKEIRKSLLETIALFLYKHAPFLCQKIAKDKPINNIYKKTDRLIHVLDLPAFVTASSYWYMKFYITKKTKLNKTKIVMINWLDTSLLEVHEKGVFHQQNRRKLPIEKQYPVSIF